jgi:hypothetical protein
VRNQSVGDKVSQASPIDTLCVRDGGAASHSGQIPAQDRTYYQGKG